MRSSNEELVIRLPDAVEAPLTVLVLTSKLRLPPPRAGIIERPSLIEKLLAATDAQLVAIVAPAGYGKTTTLAAWETRDQRPFAIIRLDSGFDDPSVLITYLATALAEVVTIAPEVFERLASPTALQRRRVLAELANSVATSAIPFVLALDDVDSLRDPESIEMLTSVLDSFPKGSQAAVSSRREPNLPLASLRAEGRLAELGAGDLRLKAAEVREVLLGNGVGASASEVDDLTGRTEGWPVAVYLAARAARSDHAHLSSFGGEDRTLTDYLRSEFLDEAPGDVARFLMRSSVLEELNGPLCDAVLEREGSSSLLQVIERLNLLLEPLDRERRWYRVHRLLRDMLRAELERVEPHSTSALLVRASQWCEDNGQLERAVSYAQAAEDADRVGELTVRHGLRLYAMGRDAALRTWFKWLAEKGVSDEAVAVLGSWLHLVAGARAEADRWARVAENGSPDRVLPDGSPVEAWTLALRAVMAQDTGQMREGASRALALLSPNSQVRPTAVAVLGAAAYLDGNLDEADRRFAEAVELGVSLGGVAAAVVSLAARSSIALERGRWDEASSILEPASPMIARAHLDGYPQAALAYAVRARLAIRSGDAQTAREAVGAAEQLLPFLTMNLAYPSLVTRLTLVRVNLELGDVGAATARLHELDALARDGLVFPIVTEQTEQLRELLKEARAHTKNGAKLTPAELRLLPQLATQRSFREIAEQLFVSVHTVKAQVTSIYRKLGVASRTQAVDEARSSGLLSD